MAENYVLKSKVRELAKNLNFRISSEAIIVVNSKVAEIMKKAAERAKKNNRKTIMPQDL